MERKKKLHVRVVNGSKIDDSEQQKDFRGLRSLNLLNFRSWLQLFQSLLSVRSYGKSYSKYQSICDYKLSSIKNNIREPFFPTFSLMPSHSAQYMLSRKSILSFVRFADEGTSEGELTNWSNIERKGFEKFCSFVFFIFFLPSPR